MPKRLQDLITTYKSILILVAVFTLGLSVGASASAYIKVPENLNRNTADIDRIKGQVAYLMRQDSVLYLFKNEVLRQLNSLSIRVNVLVCLSKAETNREKARCGLSQ